MNDFKNAILRFAQYHNFDARLENTTICLDFVSIGKLYGIFSQGKLEILSFCVNPDLQISGEIQQWMELAYNPLEPQNGCQIQGDSRLLQILKENIQQLQSQYKKSWMKYPLTRSVIYHAQSLIQRYTPPSPWASQEDRSLLQSEIRDSFRKLDRCQWEIDFLLRQLPCS